MYIIKANKADGMGIAFPLDKITSISPNDLLPDKATDVTFDNGKTVTIGMPYVRAVDLWRAAKGE